MNDTERYRITWQKHRWNRRLILIIPIAFFPVLELIVRPLYNHFQDDLILTAYAIICLFLVFFFTVRTAYLVCPRCGEHFAGTWYSLILTPHPPVGTECVHCGLKKWSMPEETERSSSSP